MYHYSDGYAPQYKDKKIFSATVLGKGPCNGGEGSVKRLAANTSLQRPHENQIQILRDLFECAVENILRVHFSYSS